MRVGIVSGLSVGLNCVGLVLDGPDCVGFVLDDQAHTCKYMYVRAIMQEKGPP